MHSKPNEHVFLKQLVIQLLIENSSDIYSYLFSLLNYKTELIGCIMGSCYSSDHIAGVYIHSAIATCNIEEPQQKYRFGTASNRLRDECVCTCGCVR